MAFNFPDAPTDGQIYTPAGGPTYQWNAAGSKWIVAAPWALASTTDVLTGTDVVEPVTSDALAALWERGTDVAAAATITLGEGGWFQITAGSGPITDIDFATPKDGRTAILWFHTGAAGLVLTNSATLLLPNGQNITIEANDVASFTQFSGDTMRCNWYVRGNGKPLVLPETVGAGSCHNAKLAHSRAGNAETWALKTLAGADPSVADPVIWVGPSGTKALVTSAVSLTASSGSTLGATNGAPFNLHFALVNDAGTFRIAVLNASSVNSWTRFPPSGVLSAVAEGGAGGADTIKTIYSNAAISSKEFADLGFFTYTLAAAGTWNAAPSVGMFGPNAPKPGDVLQAVTNADIAAVNVTSGSYVVMANKNVTITPLMAASLIHVDGSIAILANAAAELSYAKWHRGTSNNTGSFGPETWAQGDGGGLRHTLRPFGYDKPNTLSALTYTIQGQRAFGASTDYSSFYATATEIMG